MKIAYVAVAGLVLGVGGGSAVSALKVKGEIMEARAQAAADSAAAARHEATGSGHDDSGAVAVVLPAENGAAAADSLAHDVVADGEHAMSEGTPAEDLAATGEEHAQDTSVAFGDVAASEPTNTGVDGAEGPAAGPEEEPVSEALNPDGAKKLAKIFGAMKPADAAAVLAEMTDPEVKAVLLQMNDRKAAPILESFPAERAAALSSVVLRDRGGS